MASSQSEGRRQQALDKQRQAMMEEFDKQKQTLLSETEKSRPSNNRFVGQNDSMEDSLKKATVGLVTVEDFKKAREALEEAKARESVQKAEVKEERTKKRKKKVAKSTLSFGDEEVDEDEGSSSKGKKKAADGDTESGPAAKRLKLKNPAVDTSFLPDRDREEQERVLREELRQKWLKEQEAIKKEDIEVTYSYWDGSGHRKSVTCKKGDDIGTFLGKCREQFPELRGVGVDNLMYIKEDLIIPHHYTFYDFIVNKARGKSGPLFNFDVHDDVRMLADASVEKDESHAGKVVERSWYQRSKHIFPANRWEIFDPAKNYGKYTIA
ncbi:Protein fam50a [Tulasnella sp. UAMH 9824]|nr:Protein fam50a [Tulasnella sp. UAMH 9824]